MLSTGSTAFGKGPQTVTCYICGRGFGTASINIHLKACEKKFLAAEEQKPPSQRRPLPKPVVDYSSVSAMNENELEQANAAASQVFNMESLSTCSNCGRSFNADRLVVHQRSCTAETPARRVGDVHKGKGGAPAGYAGSPSRTMQHTSDSRTPLRNGSSPQRPSSAVAVMRSSPSSSLNKSLPPSTYEIKDDEIDEYTNYVASGTQVTPSKSFLKAPSSISKPSRLPDVCGRSEKDEVQRRLYELSNRMKRFMDNVNDEMRHMHEELDSLAQILSSK